MTLLKENYDIFNSCQEVFGNLPQHPFGILRAQQCDREAQSVLSGWGPDHAAPSGYLTATMALYVNRDTLELLGSMMPHLCGSSKPAASIVRDSKLF